MTMKRWIVEQDVRVTQTHYYAVEARTLEEAIEQVENTEHEPFMSQDFGDDEPYGYRDSHEFDGSDRSWADLIPGGNNGG